MYSLPKLFIFHVKMYLCQILMMLGLTAVKPGQEDKAKKPYVATHKQKHII